MRHAFGRGMRAVRGGEGVVDVDVAQGGEVLRIRGRSSPRPDGSGCFPAAARRPASSRRRASALRRRWYRRRTPPAARVPVPAPRARGVRLISVRLPLGRPKCASSTDLPPLSGDFLIVGTIPLDAGGIGDPAFFHRHVEIDAPQHALACKGGVVKGAGKRSSWRSSLRVGAGSVVSSSKRAVPSITAPLASVALDRLSLARCPDRDKALDQFQKQTRGQESIIETRIVLLDRPQRRSPATGRGRPHRALTQERPIVKPADAA